MRTFLRLESHSSLSSRNNTGPRTPLWKEAAQSVSPFEPTFAAISGVDTMFLYRIRNIVPFCVPYLSGGLIRIHNSLTGRKLPGHPVQTLYFVHSAISRHMCLVSEASLPRPHPKMLRSHMIARLLALPLPTSNPTPTRSLWISFLSEGFLCLGPDTFFTL